MRTKKTQKNDNVYAISACLLGIPCRWNQEVKINNKALKVFLKGRAIAICPEVMAGLPTPRPACEIINGDGKDVLNGKAIISDKQGINYNKKFIKGAKITLAILKKFKVKKAILKSGSPSCGVFYIYNGEFSGKKIKGRGIFAALLEKNCIKLKELK